MADLRVSGDKDKILGEGCFVVEITGHPSDEYWIPIIMDAFFATIRSDKEAKETQKGKAMKYRVYQDGKHADCIGYPEMHSSWSSSLYESKRNAEIYAFMWAYPVSWEIAERDAPEMEIGREYDYGMYEIPIMMKIEEE